MHVSDDNINRCSDNADDNINRCSDNADDNINRCSDNADDNTDSSVHSGYINYCRSTGYYKYYM
jgi:hypothetical protein